MRHCSGAKVSSSLHARSLSQPTPCKGMLTEANTSAEHSTQVLGTSINKGSGGVGNEMLWWCQGRLRLAHLFLEPANVPQGHACQSRCVHQM